MTIDEAIAEIEQSGLYGNQVHQETLVLARDALRAQQHRENPQPLTLDKPLYRESFWIYELGDLK